MAFSSGPPCGGCGEPQNINEFDGEEHYWCPRCNEPMPTQDYSDDELCCLCGEEPISASHHISYVYDITIEVCRGCHDRIHDTTAKYDELKPIYKRRVAIEKGFIKPGGN